MSQIFTPDDFSSASNDGLSDGESISPAHTVRGGRFADGPHALMTAVNASVSFDQRLWQQDIEGSKAHAAMLLSCGIIDAAAESAIQKGLDTIADNITAGQFAFSDALEDVHINIETRLQALIGDAAGRLHTARSRNDQVALDFKLWVRDAIDRLQGQLVQYLQALAQVAQQQAATVMPGFTHLQPAQPVTFGHHLMAHAATAERDLSRLRDARQRLNECPLGAAALAGTSFAIDRTHTARALGFTAPTANSIDSVSARDFALEFLSTCAIAAVHLSRFAEEIVLWMTPQFGFISLSDSWTTGSSIMPQKRNPDAAELVRGKTGRVLGNLVSLLTTMKALPLAYSKDMQEDKERVFDTADTLEMCLAVMTAMVHDMTVHPQPMRAAAVRGYAVATDLADRMTQQMNIPFRQSHHLTGHVVRLAEQAGIELHEVDAALLHQVDERLSVALCSDLTAEGSVASRTSFGGTAPAQVLQQVAALQQRLAHFTEAL